MLSAQALMYNDTKLKCDKKIEIKMLCDYYYYIFFTISVIDMLKKCTSMNKTNIY